MRAKTKLVLVVGIVLSAIGCHSARRYEPDVSRQRTSTLYLASGPYERIHVEIDVVEGAEPPQGAIDELVAFIETHCRKPVTVVMSDVIAAEEAPKGLDPSVVALRHIDGPPEGGEAKPAYIYILFYRGRGKWAGVGSVRPPYPCAAYVNMRFFDGGWFMRGSRRRMLSPALKHEVGHILSLCSGGDDEDGQYHGDGMHCYDTDCLMKARQSIGFWRALFGMDERHASELCDTCLAELEEKRALGADPSLSFHGPALVRQEDGYYVARVPKCKTLGFGGPGVSCGRQHVAQALKDIEQRHAKEPYKLAELRGELVFFFTFMTGDPSSPSVFAVRKDAVERAAEDTSGFVRRKAKDLLENGEIQPSGPFSGDDAAEWIILPDIQPAESGGDGE